MSRLTRLDSGEWLLELPGPVTEGWLLRADWLLQHSHPQLAPYQKVEAGEQGYRITISALEAVPLSEVEGREEMVPLWAGQLANLAADLEKHHFPLDLQVFRSENLGLQQDRLLVFDPGLRAFLNGDAPAAANLEAILRGYAELWKSRCPAGVPANLEWILGRCLSRYESRYHSFGEVAQAFATSVRVEVPELGSAHLHSLPHFELPNVAERTRFPWGRLWLSVTVVALVVALIWAGLQRPWPPRDFPAIVLSEGSTLQWIDARSGEFRHKLTLPGAIGRVVLGRQAMWVSCQGRKQLVSVDLRNWSLSEGSRIEADPDQMQLSSDGNRLYLLYGKRGRVLVVAVPDRPLFFLGVNPGCRHLAVDDSQILLLSQPSPPALMRYRMDQRLLEKMVETVEPCQVAVDSRGRSWSSHGSVLEQRGPELEVVQSFSLPSPCKELRAAGEGVVVHCERELGRVEAQGEESWVSLPYPLQSWQVDPKNPHRVWVCAAGSVAAWNLRLGRKEREFVGVGEGHNLLVLP